MTDKKILSLTLKKEWFDLILEGKKLFEYRELKPHWDSRMLDQDGKLEKFDEIHYRNGYNPNSPFMRVEFKGAIVLLGSKIIPVNNEPINQHTLYYVIANGEILETKNISPKKAPN